MDLKALSNKH